MEKEEFNDNYIPREIGEIDNVVKGLLEMWQYQKANDPNYLNFEITELRMELGKPENERNIRQIAILEAALTRFILTNK